MQAAAKVPKLRPVAKSQTERGVNERAAEGAEKEIGSPVRTRTYNPQVNNRRFNTTFRDIQIETATVIFVLLTRFRFHSGVPNT